MRSGTLVSTVGVLALAGMAIWYFAGRENRADLPAPANASSSGTAAGSQAAMPRPSPASVPPTPTARPADAVSTGIQQRPSGAQGSLGFDGHTQYATTPGSIALPPELGREDFEVDPQTGVMTLKRIPSAAPAMPQPAETLGPRDLPPDDVEIDPQTGRMTLKRYQQ